MRWRLGDGGVERALPVGVEDLGELERAVAALLAAARRHDATRPPDAQGLEDLDVPAGAWIEALGAAAARARAAAVLDLRLRVGRAGRRLDARVPALDLRPPTTGSGAHLEAAVLGWRFPAGTAALYEAIAGDVRGEVALGDARRARSRPTATACAS